MYHCQLKICLVDMPADFTEILRNLPPLPPFTHVFCDGDELAEADVIFACIPAPRKYAPPKLFGEKDTSSTLIVLTHPEGADYLLGKNLPVDHIWTMPMGEQLFIHHVKNWQKSRKKEMDCWETGQFLQRTLDLSPNLIWYKDKNGVHEKVNAFFCKTVNKELDEVEGKRHASIWDVEEDDPACIATERVVMETGKIHVAEENIKTGHDKRILTTYKAPLHNPDGSVMGTVGIGVDITQEKIYAEKLLQKNLTLESLFKRMDCGILCHTLDGSHVLSVNDAALRILGYESRDALQTGHFDMVAASVLDEDKPILRTAMRKLKNPDDSVNLEYRVLRPNGNILHVMGNIKLVEENGKRYYQRFLLDCTAQKMREQRERREHDRRHMELIQALSVDYCLVCLFNLATGRGKALRHDKWLAEKIPSLFAGSLDMPTAMGLYADTFVHPDDQDAFLAAASPASLRSELESRQTFYFNYRRRSGNDYCYYQMKAVRVGEDKADFDVVIGFGSVDVQVRKEMEKNNQLKDALKQANRASKAKSVFLSNMSHDIRTPMNAIVGYTSLAIRKIGDPDKVREYLGKIDSSGNHLLSLINDILDMSHIESGKAQLEEKLVSLGDILQCLGNILHPQARAKNHTLDIQSRYVRNHNFFCDQLRLNQILLNLLGNSIKYTPAGGAISLLVTELPNDGNGKGRYEFRIRDNGIGMSDEFLSHVFKPFERDEQAIVSGIEGSGLGMAITKNLVDMMDGDIEVKSAKGHGTEFILCVSFRLPENSCLPAPKHSWNRINALLLAPSDAESADLARTLMKNGLHQVDVAPAIPTGHAAPKEGYQLFILDMKLPDWEETAIKIRQSGCAPIALIGSPSDRPPLDDAWFAKPLDIPRFMKSLASLTGVAGDASLDEEMPAVLRGRRVLLVEDNEMNREIASELLEGAGLLVETAENGGKAVEILQNALPRYFDLILMDLQMPIMNGFEATERIRAMKDPAFSTIPIIAMTANTFEEDKRSALQKGMNGHVAKPIDIHELFSMLRKFLD